MADRFLNSGDGSDANGGTSWSDEKLTLVTGIAGIDAAGDRVLIDSAHTETAASLTYTCPGTNASPIQFLSVTPTGASGISALTAGATFTANSGGSGIGIGGCGYFYGLTWTMSTSSSAAMAFGTQINDSQVHENCTFNCTSVGGSSVILFGNTSAGGGGRVRLINPTFRFGATGQRISFTSQLIIQGGQWSASGTLNPTAVFLPYGASSQGRGQTLHVEGFDFSNLNAAINLVGSGQGGAVARFYGCKLPASWSGAPIADGSLVAGMRVEMYNCDSADTNYRVWIKEYAGAVVTETTIKRTGGASDGTTGYSMKLTTTANVAWPASSMYSQDLVVWNDTTGSAVTVTCEIVHDSQGAGSGSRFTNREAWLEIVGMANGSYPLVTVADDACADVITSAADQTDSSETWTTTGLTTPVKQKLAVTFTPQEKGPIIARVHLAKASKTLYFCPKLSVA